MEEEIEKKLWETVVEINIDGIQSKITVKELIFLYNQLEVFWGARNFRKILKSVLDKELEKIGLNCKVIF
jgi:transcription elongation factor GreA-like protein